jgi:hypothetical protein
MQSFGPGFKLWISLNEKRLLLFIVLINALIKSIPASHLELGNDEVYYWTYALFPDWSHFDHPPMVGFVIQLSTFNLLLDSEFFIRAGAILLSSGSILFLYFLVRRLYSEVAGLFAVILFISSFYFNLIGGLLILPDAPQIFFIIIALYFLLPSITIKDPTRKDSINIILFGIFTGLAFLSKYHSLFLWFGTGLFILFHNRIWLKKPALYLSFLLTLLLMIPVLMWNIQNDFISFTFHGNRVGLFHEPVRMFYFLQFNLGQIFYQNPVSVLIYTVSLVSFFRGIAHETDYNKILLIYLLLPLILIFTFFSLFRNTLPHWSGPAFICLIILSSDYLWNIFCTGKVNVIKPLSAALILFLIVVTAGTIQIKYGLIPLQKNKMDSRPGKNDFTLDMYGWKQSGVKFESFLNGEGMSVEERRNVTLLSDKWYPGAHIDYYISSPLNLNLIVAGSIERIHKYFWINQKRENSLPGRIFYITDSRNYTSPEEFTGYFNDIVPKDTLQITRGKKVVKLLYIYEMGHPLKDLTPEQPHRAP